VAHTTGVWYTKEDYPIIKILYDVLSAKFLMKESFQAL